VLVMHIYGNSASKWRMSQIVGGYGVHRVQT